MDTTRRGCGRKTAISLVKTATRGVVVVELLGL